MSSDQQAITSLYQLAIRKETYMDAGRTDQLLRRLANVAKLRNVTTDIRGILPDYETLAREVIGWPLANLSPEESAVEDDLKNISFSRHFVSITLERLFQILALLTLTDEPTVSADLFDFAAGFLHSSPYENNNSFYLSSRLHNQQLKPLVIERQRMVERAVLPQYVRVAAAHGLPSSVIPSHASVMLYKFHNIALVTTLLFDVMQQQLRTLLSGHSISQSAGTSDTESLRRSTPPPPPLPQRRCIGEHHEAQWVASGSLLQAIAMERLSKKPHKRIVSGLQTMVEYDGTYGLLVAAGTGDPMDPIYLEYTVDDAERKRNGVFTLEQKSTAINQKIDVLEATEMVSRSALRLVLPGFKSAETDRDGGVEELSTWECSWVPVLAASLLVRQRHDEYLGRLRLGRFGYGGRKVEAVRDGDYIAAMQVPTPTKRDIRAYIGTLATTTYGLIGLILEQAREEYNSRNRVHEWQSMSSSPI